MVVCEVRGCARAMLCAMRRPEDEVGRGEDDEFVDISQMQLLEAGPSGLYGPPYAGPAPPLAQPQPYRSPDASANASVDDLFALYFTPATHGEDALRPIGS
ncbi:unnamed protein product [Leptosia nina]|uniref:Uncharacterized protein n=1 Tax=Leptosia nina TaxID=320188 RepID=A0AAV1JZZ8_9NEOP